MSRFLLDTNILSEAVKPSPASALLEWLGAQDSATLFISTVTIGEIRRGVLENPPGKKRRGLERWFRGADGPQAKFSGRILAFDEPAALVWGALMAEGTAKGRPRNGLDMVVASIAQTNGCTIATANERDFWGLNYLNPCK